MKNANDNELDKRVREINRTIGRIKEMIGPAPLQSEASSKPKLNGLEQIPEDEPSTQRTTAKEFQPRASILHVADVTKNIITPPESPLEPESQTLELPPKENPNRLGKIDDQSRRDSKFYVAQVTQEIINSATSPRIDSPVSEFSSLTLVPEKQADTLEEMTDKPGPEAPQTPQEVHSERSSASKPDIPKTTGILKNPDSAKKKKSVSFNLQPEIRTFTEKGSDETKDTKDNDQKHMARALNDLTNAVNEIRERMLIAEGNEILEEKNLKKLSVAEILERFPEPPATRPTRSDFQRGEALSAIRKAQEQIPSSPRGTFLWTAGSLSTLPETASLDEIRKLGLNVSEASDKEAGIGRIVKILTNPTSGSMTAILQTADQQRVDSPHQKSLKAVDSSRVSGDLKLLLKVSFLSKKQLEEKLAENEMLKNAGDIAKAGRPPAGSGRRGGRNGS